MSEKYVPRSDDPWVLEDPLFAIEGESWSIGANIYKVRDLEEQIRYYERRELSLNNVVPAYFLGGALISILAIITNIYPGIIDLPQTMDPVLIFLGGVSIILIGIYEWNSTKIIKAKIAQFRSEKEKLEREIGGKRLTYFEDLADININGSSLFHVGKLNSSFPILR